MDRSMMYAVVGALFVLIGIAAIVRGDLVAGSLMSIAGIALGIAAHRNWNRNDA
jgi:drug/metabolite transporter (DMT)-like permease